MTPAGNWTDPEFLVEADYPLQVKEELVYRLCRILAPCPIIDVRYKGLNQGPAPSSVVWHTRDDRGTDNEHPGPISHKNTTQKILEFLESR